VARHRRSRKGPTSKKPDSKELDLYTVQLALLVLFEVIRFLAGPWMT
jgi:hypothetical protein